MTELTKILTNPEEHYPGNFDTPQRANALLTGLCQDAATEIERLTAEAEADKTIIEYHEATIERLTDLLNKAQPDYAWPTIEDYEKEVGFKVNDAFKAAWTMARTTNDLFKQMGENT
jgi:hypothetical protein